MRSLIPKTKEIKLQIFERKMYSGKYLGLRRVTLASAFGCYVKRSYVSFIGRTVRPDKYRTLIRQDHAV